MVFAKLNPEAFQTCIIEWERALETLTAGQVIALDGKQLRRAQDGLSEKAFIYMDGVTPWLFRKNRAILF